MVDHYYSKDAQPSDLIPGALDSYTYTSLLVLCTAYGGFYQVPFVYVRILYAWVYKRSLF